MPPLASHAAPLAAPLPSGAVADEEGAELAETGAAGAAAGPGGAGVASGAGVAVAAVAAVAAAVAAAGAAAGAAALACELPAEENEDIGSSREEAKEEIASGLPRGGAAGGAAAGPVRRVTAVCQPGRRWALERPPKTTIMPLAATPPCEACGRHGCSRTLRSRTQPPPKSAEKLSLRCGAAAEASWAATEVARRCASSSWAGSGDIELSRRSEAPAAGNRGAPCPCPEAAVGAAGAAAAAAGAASCSGQRASCSALPPRPCCLGAAAASSARERKGPRRTRRSTLSAWPECPLAAAAAMAWPRLRGGTRKPPRLPERAPRPHACSCATRLESDASHVTASLLLAPSPLSPSSLRSPTTQCVRV